MGDDLVLPGTHDQCLPMLVPIKAMLKRVVPLPCRAVRLVLTDARIFELIPMGDEYQVVEVKDGKRQRPGKALFIDDHDGLWEILR